jgi:multiple antibiotic resistance protein
MTFSVNELILHFTGLVAIFSPVAAIAPYIGVAGHFDRKVQHRLSWRVALFSFLFLLVGSWTGVYILRFLGISLPALRAAGGVILFLSSLPMVMKGHSPRQKKVDTEEQDDWKSIVVVPLVFPFTIGAASLSYVITLMNSSKTVLDQLVVVGIILLDGIVIWLTYFFAGPLGRRMGKTGNDILVRVGGIIVLALGITLLTGGLKELLPGLAA